MKRFSLTILATAVAAASFGSGILPNSINQTMSFGESGVYGTAMTIAFDGTDYWATAGGYSFSGEAEFNAAGAQIGAFNPGLDFRSDFTSGSTVYAKQFYNTTTIYKQTAPGSYTPYVTLTGGYVDSQAAVVLGQNGTEFDEFDYGTLYRYGLNGSYMGSVAFSGFGSYGGENGYPDGRGVAAIGDDYFTYTNQTVSAWDLAGNRIGQANLVGAGTSFDSEFSFSYANGMFFVEDYANGPWRGYAFNAVPEPGPVAVLGLGVIGLIARRRKS